MLPIYTMTKRQLLGYCESIKLALNPHWTKQQLLAYIEKHLMAQEPTNPQENKTCDLRL